jgi:hypothetical protein
MAPAFRYDGHMRRAWIACRAVGLVFLAGVAFGQQPKSPAKEASGICGPLTGQALKCPLYGFTYTVPFGWVDRTDDMQASATEPSSDDGQQAAQQPGKSETLLAIFERPPGATGETINSAVVIAAESLKDYRGIKGAADYLGPVSELAEQRGFKVVNDPYEFTAGTKRLARADYSKPRGKLTMWQSTLVMIEKGYIISFTFVGGSEDEIDQLIGQLSFTRTAPAHKCGLLRGCRIKTKRLSTAENAKRAKRVRKESPQEMKICLVRRR